MIARQPITSRAGRQMPDIGIVGILAGIDLVGNAEAFELLVDEKLSADESFRIFISLSNDALRDLALLDNAPSA